MLKTIRYSTDDLDCVFTQDGNGEPCYAIIEKENPTKNMAVYYDKTQLFLAADFPKPENTYKYFDQMCKIIQFLYEGE